MARITSPGYPGSTLSEAIDLTTIIFEKNRQNPTDREAAVRDMGYSGLTGTSAKILSDLSHFGLVERSGKGGIRVTDTAVRIILPHNNAEKQAALFQAAHTPALFRKIREQWPDGFISENSLRAYLMRQGFASVAIHSVIKSYLKTYDLLRQEGATESNGTPLERGGESMVEEQQGASAKTSEGRGSTFEGAGAGTAAGDVAIARKREGIALMSGERIVFVEEGGPSQYLKLVASGPLNSSLLEALEDYVKRQKKRLEVGSKKRRRARMTNSSSYDDCCFVEITFSNARSNVSPVCSMPSFRAASMNRSDWALSDSLGFFGFGFAFGFAGWAIPTPSPS